jgi:hypothetical protein
MASDEKSVQDIKASILGTVNAFEDFQKAEAFKLDALVRQYCRAQKETWRKVPYLALQTYGRQRMYDSRWRYYIDAFNNGLWDANLEHSEISNTRLYVDLATGEIVLKGSKDSLIPYDRNKLLYHLFFNKDFLSAAADPYFLNAQHIVDALEEEGKRPYRNRDSISGYPIPIDVYEKRVEEYSRQLIRQRGIDKLYTRMKGFRLLTCLPEREIYHQLSIDDLAEDRNKSTV